MKYIALTLLAVLPMLGACRHPQSRPDYDATRQRANEAQQDLNRQGDVPQNK